MMAARACPSSNGGTLDGIGLGLVHVRDARRLRHLLATHDADAAPDRGGVQIEMLADAQERERPGAVVVADPAEGLAQYLAALGRLRDGALAADGDGVLQDGGHQPLLTGPRRVPLQPGEVLHGQDGLRFEQAWQPVFGLLRRESLHAPTSLGAPSMQTACHEGCAEPAGDSRWSANRPGGRFYNREPGAGPLIDATRGAMQNLCRR